MCWPGVCDRPVFNSLWRVTLARVIFLVAMGPAVGLAGPAPDPQQEFCADSNTEPDANLNELKSTGGQAAPNIEFIEFKVLADNVDIAGWELCYANQPNQESCFDVGVGNGAWHDDDDTVSPDGTDDSGPNGDTVFFDPTWIVYEPQNLKEEGGEAILFNADGEVMDYIRWSNDAGACDDDDKRWDVMPNQSDGHSCGACFDNRDPNDKVLARSEPDGTGDWGNADTPTEGASNDEPAETAEGFETSTDGTASTCVREEVLLTVLNRAGNVVQGYTGTVSINTSTNNGTWFLTDDNGNSSDPAQGALTDTTADDGAATYQFDQDDDGTVAFYLSNTHADDLQVTFDEVNGTRTATTIVISFRDNAFVITPVTCTGTTCPNPGTEVVAGRDHTFQVDMIRRDPDTGSCGNATQYEGDFALKAWMIREAVDPGGSGPTIGASGELPDAVPGSNNISLTFLSGIATFDLSTIDVGKYRVNIRDDSRTFASAVDINGATDILTVRPFGFAFTDINDLGSPATANPGTDTPTGPIFTTAGTNFGLTVGAYLWDSTDDGDLDGIPDSGADLTNNGLTLSFAWDADVGALAPFEPSTGTLGNINGGFINLADFVDARATLETVNYTEVGSVTLQADAADYLGTVGVNVIGDTTNDGSNGLVGRFTPFELSVTLDTTPAFAPACSSDTQPFTYMDQPFDYDTGPVVTITAVNALGGTTTNYDGAWWRLDDFSETYTHDGDALSSGVTLDDAVATHTPIDCSAGNCNGTFQTTFAGPFTYARDAAEIAPVASLVDISFVITDADSIGYSGNPFVVNDINFTNGDNEQRWGRLVVGTEAGSPSIALNVPLTAEYYDGTSYLVNIDDDCSEFTLADDVDLTSPESGTVAGDEPVNVGSGTTELTAAPILVDGLHMFEFSPPGDTGFVDIEMDLTAANTPWFLFDWDGDGAFDEHPTGRALFGIISRPREVIYIREPWK